MKEDEKMDKISVQVGKSLLVASDCIKNGDYVNAAAIIAEFEEVEKTCSKYRALVDSMKKKLADERRLNATKDPEASIQDIITAQLGLGFTTRPTAAATTQPASTHRPTAQQPRRQQPTPSTPPVTTAALTTPTQPAAPTPPQGPVPQTQPATPTLIEPPPTPFLSMPAVPPTTPTPTQPNKFWDAIKTAAKNVIG